MYLCVTRVCVCVYPSLHLGGGVSQHAPGQGRGVWTRGGRCTQEGVHLPPETSTEVGSMHATGMNPCFFSRFSLRQEIWKREYFPLLGIGHYTFTQS